MAPLRYTCCRRRALLLIGRRATLVRRRTSCTRAKGTEPCSIRRASSSARRETIRCDRRAEFRPGSQHSFRPTGRCAEGHCQRDIPRAVCSGPAAANRARQVLVLANNAPSLACKTAGGNTRRAATSSSRKACSPSDRSAQRHRTLEPASPRTGRERWHRPAEPNHSPARRPGIHVAPRLGDRRHGRAPAARGSSQPRQVSFQVVFTERANPGSPSPSPKRPSRSTGSEAREQSR